MASCQPRDRTKRGGRTHRCAVHPAFPAVENPGKCGLFPALVHVGEVPPSRFAAAPSARGPYLAAPGSSSGGKPEAVYLYGVSGNCKFSVNKNKGRGNRR